MHIVEVNTPATAKAFLEVNVMVHRGNPYYIRPLDNEVNDVFDPAKNKLFKYGTAKRWLLKNNQGQYIGRVAAFTNSKYINKGTDYPVGGVGYFDCINNQAAANQLLDTAKAWLVAEGMEAMDGNINFGDRDKNWGLMVEGFDREPVYGMSYNPPYYQHLFETYGFKNYYNQYFFRMIMSEPLPPRFQERHAKFAAKPEYSAKHISLKNLAKHAHDFATVYNAAWAQHGEGKEITPDQVMKLFGKMKPIMDETLVWFAYYKEDPIAMFINIPDINQYFKHFNGKMGLLQKLHLLYMKYTGTCKIATGLAFGVVPKFQALGVDSFLIQEAAFIIQGNGRYTDYEMGWAADWNPKMHNIYKNLGGKQSRRMVTYRYIFDEQKHPFERHPIMEYK
ncbi:MAG TPA: hypothetical protein DCQ29_15285 [Chitinophagaceae bacterium]|nr:hypothetical protein [Chitinophagaceae bacterium]